MTTLWSKKVTRTPSSVANINSVGLDDGKCGQKNQINGSFLPLDVKGDQKSDGEKKRGEQKQGFALDKLLDPGGEEEHCSDEGGDGELHRQQPVHLPHEP